MEKVIEDIRVLLTKEDEFIIYGNDEFRRNLFKEMLPLTAGNGLFDIMFSFHNLMNLFIKLRTSLDSGITEYFRKTPVQEIIDYIKNEFKGLVRMLKAYKTKLEKNNGDLDKTNGEYLISFDINVLETEKKELNETFKAFRDKLNDYTTLNNMLLKNVDFLNSGIFAMLRYISSSEHENNVQMTNLSEREQKVAIQNGKLENIKYVKKRLEKLYTTEMELTTQLNFYRTHSDDNELLEKKVAKQKKSIELLTNQIKTIVDNYEDIEIKKYESKQVKLSDVQKQLIKISITPLLELNRTIPNLVNLWLTNNDVYSLLHRLIIIIDIAKQEMFKKIEKLRSLVVMNREKHSNDLSETSCFITPPIEIPNALHCWKVGDILSAIDYGSRKVTDRKIQVQCCEYHRKIILDKYEETLYSEIYDNETIENWTLFLKGVWNL
jgi:hypothetical protein